MKSIVFIVFIGMLFFCSCGQETVQKEAILESNEKAPNGIVDTSFYIAHNQDSILVTTRKSSSKDDKGTIILFPGWDYNHTHWNDSSEFLNAAVKRGYNVIMPDVKKTIYTMNIYPETRVDWKNEVTRRWINETFLPKLIQDFHVDSHPLFAFGISTGGRGALFTVMENQEMFAGGAAISGDYDQAFLPEDNLYKGFFGTKKQFPERYKGIENPMTQLIGLKVPFYFGHSEIDQIVPVSHTKHLEEALIKKTLTNNATFSYSFEGGHTYSYWDQELMKALDFFEKQ